MHYLHKILVYIPDAVSDMEQTDRKTMADAIRKYAEDETECYYEQAFDWRETDTAGRWEGNYPQNVLFAQDDVERFLKEIEACRIEQREDLESCLAQLEHTVGTDLKEIYPKVLSMTSFEDNQNGCSHMTTYYLLHLSRLLYGYYMAASMFYDIREQSACIYGENLQKIKNSPKDWALVMFDYHN